MRYALMMMLLVLFTCAPVCAGFEVVTPPPVEQWVTGNDMGRPVLRPNLELPSLPPYIRVVCRAAEPWSVDPLKRAWVLETATGTATLAAVFAACPTVLDAKHQRLWEAASSWERQNISGVALSLLTLGVAQNKPKALAIAAWSSRLWNGFYYPRKAIISLDSEPDCDFSIVGDMPYSVPELSLEVWGQ